MTINQLRVERVANRISGDTLAKKLGIQRALLSRVENGLVLLDPVEVRRYSDGLEELVKAKRAGQRAAERLGWPVTV